MVTSKMRTTLLIPFSLLLALLLPVAGCMQQPAQTYEIVADTAAADAIQARLLGQAKFNVSKVYVTRLTIDGNEVAITSLVPAFFRGYEPRERGFKLRKGHSFTLLAFNEERNGLELLTRDFQADKAYHEVVPLASLEAGMTLRFPLIDDSGVSQQAEFAFQELRVK
jgi:hypothetical protein